jgi:hypothetical protein
MITATHLNSFNKDLWVDSKFNRNDFLVSAESAYVSIDHTWDSIKSATNGFLKAGGYLILLPLRTVLLIVNLFFYLAITPWLRLYFNKQYKKAIKFRTGLEEEISKNLVSKKDLMKGHKETKALLDEIMPRLHKLNGEPIMKPALDKLMSEIQKVEQITRVAAYPERNEIVLSYSEITELRELAEMAF